MAGYRTFSSLSITLLLAAVTSASSAQQPPAPTGGTVRVEVEVVNLYVTVKDDDGALVTDLQAEDFEIREDGKKQKIRYFSQETDRPLTLALLIDTSISQQKVLPAEKATAATFLRQTLRPDRDLATLLSFDMHVDLLQDFTADLERLHEALDRAYINSPYSPTNPGPFPRGRSRSTRLYDAIYLAAIEKLASEVGRKAIIVLSDGQDAGSMVDKDEAIQAAHRGDTMVYTIGIIDRKFYRDRRQPFFGANVLRELAEETGGRALFPDDARELQEAFDQIARELRSQYSIGYSPTNRKHDGKFREVDVKVKKDGLRVQARKGYYAPAE